MQNLENRKSFKEFMSRSENSFDEKIENAIQFVEENLTKKIPYKKANEFETEFLKIKVLEHKGDRGFDKANFKFLEVWKYEKRFIILFRNNIAWKICLLELNHIEKVEHFADLWEDPLNKYTELYCQEF